MPDLPPDVRERAVQAATDALLEWGHDGEIGMSFEVVDAVVAVVAPEISRPLQAENEELEAALTEHGAIEIGEATYQCGWERAYKRDLHVADARLMDADARVEVLTAALTRLNHACSHNIDDLPRARGIARAALAAGKIETGESTTAT